MPLVVQQFALVGLGGALGSMARFGLGLAIAPVSRGLPLATFVINVAGSLAIGLCAGLWSGEPTHHAGRLLVMVGVLGGFTTFSSFELETLSLAQQGLRTTALVYVLASCMLGFGAAALGLWLGKRG